MIKVTIQADSKFPVNRGQVRETVDKVVAEYGLKEAVVGIVVVGDRKMTALNQQWMKREGTTDVLSFPMEDMGAGNGSALGFVMPEGPLVLGDVVVCWPQAVRQAAERNMMVDDEVAVLVEHGVRHLLGEHHDD